MTKKETSFSVSTPRETYACLGHERAEQEVLSAWLSGRMHHAWLLTGPRGIGKATFAYRMVRFLLVEEQASPAVADLAVSPDHPVARRIAQGTHGNFKVLERSWDEKRMKRQGSISVEAVREVGAFLSMTSSEVGWRVVLIDAADDMTRSAANGVLKILEEPPERAVLIVLAHNPSRLLPTIRSRCRRLSLAPLPLPVMETLLEQILPDLDHQDRSILARLGEGSVGRSLELACRDGLTLYRDMIALLRSVPRVDSIALHAFAERAGRDEDAFRTAAELMLRQLARLVAAGAGSILSEEIVPGENEAMQTAFAAAPLDRRLEVWEKNTRLFERADAVNLDGKHVFLNAFLNIERLLCPR